MDGSLRPKLAVGVSGSTAQIKGEDHGVKSNQNLFFSFQKFNLPNAGDNAVFSCSNGFCGANAGDIRNVISRVNITGNNGPSTINGGISFSGTNLSTANLWFFNPQGVIFGNGAAVNVPGAFHVANATQLSIGAISFDLATIDVSSLNVDPGVFGFAGVDVQVDPLPADPVTITPTNGVTLGDATLSGGEIRTGSGAIEVNGTLLTTRGTALVAGGTGTITISGDSLIVENNKTTTLNSGGNLHIQTTDGVNVTAEAGAASLTSTVNVKTLSTDAAITNNGNFFVV
jgi:filamentous hemagglutinin family protein